MTVTIRKAGAVDVEQLIRLRFDFLADDFEPLAPGVAQAIERQLRSYFSASLGTGRFFAILAEVDGEAVATAFLAIEEVPANPSCLNGKKGTVLNVFTHPKFRKQGIATSVMTALIDEARRLAVSAIVLAATDQGRRLYERLGFGKDRYIGMRLVLTPSVRTGSQ